MNGQPQLASDTSRAPCLLLSRRRRRRDGYSRDVGLQRRAIAISAVDAIGRIVRQRASTGRDMENAAIGRQRDTRDLLLRSER